MFEFMRSQINAKRCRSAWDRGVREYALEIIDGIEDCAVYYGELPANVKECLRYALNGAMDWTQYSEGGCSLVCNHQIANRLCTPSELRKTQNGAKAPNPRESWISCQTRALYQAWRMVEMAFNAFQQIVKGGC